MNKLIKINKNHYVICDDYEIKEGDKFIIEATIGTKFFSILTANSADEKVISGRLKITHSTKPLETKYNQEQILYEAISLHENKLIFDKIKPLSLLEAEEVINGYSVEEMASEYVDSIRNKIDGYCYIDIQEGYKKGFNAHQELVKDKLFTVEDMERAIDTTIELMKNKTTEFRTHKDTVIQSLLPKTEWECYFDEQGKIKLI